MRFRSLVRFLLPPFTFRHRTGFCHVCGHATLFLFIDKPELVRNHAICIRCGCCARNRHIARWVIGEFAERGIRSLSDFRGRQNLEVLNTAALGILAAKMGKGPNLYHSEYFDGVPSGASKDGILCQDLKNLAFPDNALDLIISEDVFEHIPGCKQAFAEVYRVLKPGGVHVYAIPFFFDRKTRELFRWVDGKPVLDEPIEFHGDPVRGQIPCFNYLGYDSLDWQREMGFEVRIERSSYAEQKNLGTYDCFTLIAKKL